MMEIHKTPPVSIGREKVPQCPVSEAAEKFLSCLLGFIIGQDAGGDRSCYQYERGYDSHQFESNN